MLKIYISGCCRGSRRVAAFPRPFSHEGMLVPQIDGFSKRNSGTSLPTVNGPKR